LTVRVDPGAHAFRNFWNVRATEVAVALPDLPEVPTDAELTVRLIHNGAGVIVDRRGVARAFTHEPRTIGFVYSYQRRKITGHATIGDEKAGFANLSPFTTWTLDFNMKGNDWLDYSKIRSVTLTFRGYWKVNPLFARSCRQPSAHPGDQKGIPSRRSTRTQITTAEPKSPSACVTNRPPSTNLRYPTRHPRIPSRTDR
jgi:hypothetical protein